MDREDRAGAEPPAYEGWRSGPRFWSNHRFNRDTLPVVGISWYEARAYCQWLGAELRRHGELGAEEEVRLPTEEEWSWVATGEASRTYAWGPDFAAWRTNSDESGLAGPSPVHMYPGGQTPNSGVWDLCENAWEWLAIVGYLAGGAYFQNATSVRASSRARGRLRNWNFSGGFRCGVVPISRGRP